MKRKKGRWELNPNAPFDFSVLSAL